MKSTREMLFDISLLAKADTLEKGKDLIRMNQPMPDAPPEVHLTDLDIYPPEVVLDTFDHDAPGEERLAAQLTLSMKVVYPQVFEGIHSLVYRGMTARQVEARFVNAYAEIDDLLSDMIRVVAQHLINTLDAEVPFFAFKNQGGEK